VPDAAILSRDYRQNGLPILLVAGNQSINNQREFWYDPPISYSYGWASLPSNEYYVLFWRDGFSYARGETNFFLENCCALLGYASITIPEITSFPGPAPQYTKYYLKYGVSQNAELEIQLARTSAAGEVIYHHFPIEFPWEFWEYAISNDGKIAWTDPSTCRIYVSDGETTVVLPEDQKTCSCIGWLDDDTLLYLNNGYEPPSKTQAYPLMAYHVDTGIAEPLQTINGDNIEMKYIMGNLAVDAEGKYIACYTSVLADHGWIYVSKPTIVSLETGECFVWDLQLEFNADVDDIDCVNSLVWLP